MNEAAPRKRSAWRWLIAGFLAALIIAVGVAVLRVGQWLVVQDPLESADAAVVLSGRMPVRALEAAQIYRQNYVSQVWVMRPQGPAERLKEIGIAYVGEEFYNQKVLMAEGVPADAIRAPERETENTEDELTEVARLLREEGAGKVIVVTTKPHTRRVRAIWRRLVGAQPRLIVRYASEDTYDGAHWWRNTADALDVVREVFGLLNVWAGFPVRYVRR
jgi:uncharacterized SAM-binding protein YcdF (DUF218 family)